MKTNLIQEDYKVFAGRYYAQMPLLVKEGLTPLNVKQIMGYRIKAIQSKDKDEIRFWLSRISTGSLTGLAYCDNGLIVEPNSQLLLNINPNSLFNKNGHLALIKLEQFKKLAKTGEDIKINEIIYREQFEELAKKYEVIKINNIIYNKHLTEKEAKEHILWIKLAQEDKVLLDEYVDSIFSKTKKRENMMICLPNDVGVPGLSSWDLSNLKYQSIADSGDSLYNGTILIGIRSQNLEQKIYE